LPLRKGASYKYQAMPDLRPAITIDPADYDAALFDLDGVLTSTARVHAAAWKQLFDRLLEQHAQRSGGVFVPFDPDADYRRYLDGKTREDGIVTFLASRGIALPPGEQGDDAGLQTVRALSKL